MRIFSRRYILFVISAIPAALSRRLAKSRTSIAELGNRFDILAARFDRAVETGSDLDWPTTLGLDKVANDLITAPAKTIDELAIKAKVACWARLGDLECEENSTIDHRMGLSIVKDLIRLVDPTLERPGALRRLVQH